MSAVGAYAARKVRVWVCAGGCGAQFELEHHPHSWRVDDLAAGLRCPDCIKQLQAERDAAVVAARVEECRRSMSRMWDLELESLEPEWAKQ